MSYSIRDLENLSGIKAHTLRIWEQRYNILQPKRTDTNIRYYDDQDLKLILNISLLNDNGYKISKIAGMSPDELHEEVISLTQKSSDFPEQIQALTIAMIDLDEERFEKVISTNILHYGFEKTMIKIVFPFLTRIGYLWQTGTVNPAQEHFMTFLIRQKLIVAIDGLVNRKTDSAKKFMLFLPEGELHEISLLFANFLVRSRDHNCIYLGQSLPLIDVQEAHKIYRPDFMLVICTTTPNQSDIQEYISTLNELFPETTILLSGYQVVGQDINIGENMRIITDVERLIHFLEHLSLN